MEKVSFILFRDRAENLKNYLNSLEDNYNSKRYSFFDYVDHNLEFTKITISNLSGVDLAIIHNAGVDFGFNK